MGVVRVITREQVKDLQPGDVVELRHRLFPEITLRGPVSVSGAREHDLVLPPVWIRDRSGDPAEDTGMWADLTVISRAPRPLYVNHPRTEPFSGDVARDEDIPETTDSFVYLTHVAHHSAGWFGQYGKPVQPGHLPARLRLLIDGETGQVVYPTGVRHLLP
jgi:hypothetical protein